MGDEELLGALRETFPVLDRWRYILGSQVEPAKDSELAEDDLTWPPVPTSSWVLLGLGAAREHLQAIRLLVEAGELVSVRNCDVGPDRTDRRRASGVDARAR